jgi:hypothetical protein
LGLINYGSKVLEFTNFTISLIRRFPRIISHFLAISQNLGGMEVRGGCDLGGGEGKAILLTVFETHHLGSKLSNCD